jgi:hypothetical protein
MAHTPDSASSAVSSASVSPAAVSCLRARPPLTAAGKARGRSRGQRAPCVGPQRSGQPSASNTAIGSR